MRFTDYIKDRLTAVVVYTVAAAVIVVFMRAFRTPNELIYAVMLIMALAACIICAWDYLRRQRFYNKLVNDLNALEKKYLISEMIENDDFLEAGLLSDILKTSNKSMCDNVAFYKHENAAFREFIELWVHEVKLPVSSLALMLHNSGSDNKASEQLRRIDSCIDTVLYYTRCDNAEKDFMIKENSLKALVRNSVVKCREDIQLNDISLDVDIPDVTVMTDGKWIEFILVQLISNSIKYKSGERDSIIRISADEDDDRITLRFYDNGIGIQESDLPYVFYRSFTGENGRIRSKSTGMGLYIVKNLCEKLGHSVSAASKQGEFTEIDIIFGKNKFYLK